MIIPDQLQKNIISIYADKGRKWLTDLPALLSYCESHLAIKLESCYSNLSFHYVAPAVFSNGKKAVLKCGVPTDQGLEKEVMALRHFNGQGCVKLFHFDQAFGFMLLEKADPGEILETLADEQQACVSAVNVMHQLHKPVTEVNQFDTLQNWFAGLNDFHQQYQDRTSLFSVKLIDKAQRICHDLFSSMNKKVLLHGDLHYANILSSNEHGWIAIDPKGVIGEAEFEIPLPRLGQEINKKTIQRHIDRFVEIAEFDRQRIIDWLFVKAVLAAWWSLEDNGEIWQPFIECAELVSHIN